jgi:hypothetical protein
MARSGSLSEWERRLADQRPDDERLARERRQQDKEEDKARQQEHLESRQRTADERTAAVAEQIKSLDEVLTSALALPPMSFDRLMATARTPAFDPGPLGVALPGPEWSDFAPARPRGLSRFLGRFLGGPARTSGRPRRRRTASRPRRPGPNGARRTTVATPQNAYKMWKSSHGDVTLPVGVHLPNVKAGCQKLRGQKKTEMKYCTQLWSDVKLAAVDGIWGGAVL